MMKWEFPGEAINGSLNGLMNNNLKSINVKPEVLPPIAGISYTFQDEIELRDFFKLTKEKKN